MWSRSPLDDILASRSHVRILRALALARRDLNLSGRDVARRAGVSPTRALKVLAELAEQGLVEAHRHDNYGLYWLNEDHSAAGIIRELFEWELGLAEEFHDWLRRALAASRHIRAAFLVTAADDQLELHVLHDGETVEVLETLHALVNTAYKRFGIDLSFRERPETKAPRDVGTLVYRARLPAAEEAHGEEAPHRGGQARP